MSGNEPPHPDCVDRCPQCDSPYVTTELKHRFNEVRFGPGYADDPQGSIYWEDEHYTRQRKCSDCGWSSPVEVAEGSENPGLQYRRPLW